MQTWVVMADIGRWDFARTEVNSVHSGEESAKRMVSKLTEEYEKVDKSTIDGFDQPQWFRVEGPFEVIED